MPYIDQESRERIENFNQEEKGRVDYLSKYIKTEGELNYVISRLCNEYLKNKGEKYSVYNTIVGVLECAKLELYRRKVSKYEKKKCHENGDIYYDEGKCN